MKTADYYQLEWEDDNSILISPLAYRRQGRSLRLREKGMKREV
jgi:hypothetical protein